ncbi:MAG: hypothetical protein JHD33_02740 [Chthoniobacterales bacterium]|nr:hypothetical protein [Chthoniobacterales bacterium]
MKAAFCLIFCLAALPGQATEVQQHGLSFEHWVADTFFGGHRASGPTDKWDIPGSANKNHGRIPVNPKATQYGEPVLLGDALRQYDIKEPFLLIVGFWEQDGRDKKFVQSLVARIEPEQWRKLWGPVTRQDLEAMDKLVKDTARPVAAVRREVLRRKKLPPFSQAVIQLNPKIDQSQRRLQCSISYVRLFKNLAPGRDRKAQPSAEIFGRTIRRLSVFPRRDL